MNILFVKLSAIGDVVQTLPALEAIHNQFPGSRITWVVEEAAAGILDGHPRISRVLISRRKTWIAMLKNPCTFRKGVGSIIGFLRELRSIRYDIAIDFQGLLKSGILIGCARAERKIGFNRTREFSYLFLNERLPAYDIEKHALERYLDIARHLGARNPRSSCTLPVQADYTVMANKVSGIRKEGQRLIVINPVARWKTKLWPERNFSELADLLLKEKKCVVIFTGSADDRELNGRIIAGMRHKAFNWAGEMSLRELAALAQQSDLFITTDTGPMHLAAAAGAKVLALFGPTAPWRTGPYGQGHVVVRTGIDCSPCFKRKCDRDVACMKGITASEVLKRIEFK